MAIDQDLMQSKKMRFLVAGTEFAIEKAKEMDEAKMKPEVIAAALNAFGMACAAAMTAYGAVDAEYAKKDDV